MELSRQSAKELDMHVQREATAAIRMKEEIARREASAAGRLAAADIAPLVEGIGETVLDKCMISAMKTCMSQRKSDMDGGSPVQTTEIVSGLQYDEVTLLQWGAGKQELYPSRKHLRSHLCVPLENDESESQESDRGARGQDSKSQKNARKISMDFKTTMLSDIVICICTALIASIGECEHEKWRYNLEKGGGEAVAEWSILEFGCIVLMECIARKINTRAQGRPYVIGPIMAGIWEAQSYEVRYSMMTGIANEEQIQTYSFIMSEVIRAFTVILGQHEMDTKMCRAQRQVIKINATVRKYLSTFIQGNEKCEPKAQNGNWYKTGCKEWFNVGGLIEYMYAGAGSVKKTVLKKLHASMLGGCQGKLYVKVSRMMLQYSAPNLKFKRERQEGEQMVNILPNEALLCQRDDIIKGCSRVVYIVGECNTLKDFKGEMDAVTIAMAGKWKEVHEGGKNLGSRQLSDSEEETMNETNKYVPTPRRMEVYKDGIGSQIGRRQDETRGSIKKEEYEKGTEQTVQYDVISFTAMQYECRHKWYRNIGAKPVEETFHAAISRIYIAANGKLNHEGREINHASMSNVSNRRNMEDYQATVSRNWYGLRRYIKNMPFPISPVYENLALEKWIKDIGHSWADFSYVRNSDRRNFTPMFKSAIEASIGEWIHGDVMAMPLIELTMFLAGVITMAIPRRRDWVDFIIAALLSMLQDGAGNAISEYNMNKRTVFTKSECKDDTLKSEAHAHSWDSVEFECHVEGRGILDVDKNDEQFKREFNSFIMYDGCPISSWIECAVECGSGDRKEQASFLQRALNGTYWQMQRLFRKVDDLSDEWVKASHTEPTPELVYHALRLPSKLKVQRMKVLWWMVSRILHMMMDITQDMVEDKDEGFCRTRWLQLAQTTLERGLTESVQAPIGVYPDNKAFHRKITLPGVIGWWKRKSRQVELRTRIVRSSHLSVFGEDLPSELIQFWWRKNIFEWIDCPIDDGSNCNSSLWMMRVKQALEATTVEGDKTYAVPETAMLLFLAGGLKRAPLKMQVKWMAYHVIMCSGIYQWMERNMDEEPSGIDGEPSWTGWSQADTMSERTQSQESGDAERDTMNEHSVYSSYFGKNKNVIEEMKAVLEESAEFCFWRGQVRRIRGNSQAFGNTSGTTTWSSIICTLRFETRMIVKHICQLYACSRELAEELRIGRAEIEVPERILRNCRCNDEMTKWINLFILVSERMMEYNIVPDIDAATSR